MNRKSRSAHDIKIPQSHQPFLNAMDASQFNVNQERIRSRRQDQFADPDERALDVDDDFFADEVRILRVQRFEPSPHNHEIPGHELVQDGFDGAAEGVLAAEEGGFVWELGGGGF
jgi:hypothetical protein